MNRKGWCRYKDANLEFRLIDKSVLEKFLKKSDATSSPVGELLGNGFSVRVSAAADGSEATVTQQIKAAGLMFLDCQKDFAPHDGVKVIEAATPGCRYTDTNL
ncbi:hypothetical protein ACFQ7F_39460 [Streptomyces sp. NPDC056486]|uniref:hypothetical protein n=1 Tax=Streptomyces sp. NPDC056486 TaxID=3345835 RepID=UPI003678C717